MQLFAEIPADVKSAVESLQRIYAIVLALAIAESFKQFIADDALKPEDRYIHKDRIPALISFMLLVVPFYHGMSRYLFDVYIQPQRLAPDYGFFLAADCLAFTFEAWIFFVLSRCLQEVQWRRFYFWVMSLLSFDGIWGAYTMAIGRAPAAAWVLVNFVTVGLLLGIWGRVRDDHSRFYPRLATVVILVRTIVDFWLSWRFYFPSLNDP
jgi:hypothetical protein